MKRRAYAMAVPTNDSAVRARLRRLGEPITLFGEREMERRDRLRSFMVRLEAEGQLERLLMVHEDEQASTVGTGADEEGDEPQQYPFYTEGSNELLEARIDIAKFSIARAKARIERSKRRRDDPDEDEDAEAKFVVEQAGEFVLECSEIGDERPLSGCSFSQDGTMLATRFLVLAFLQMVWSGQDFKPVKSLVGHEDKVTGLDISGDGQQIATVSHDHTIKIWSSRSSGKEKAMDTDEKVMDVDE